MGPHADITPELGSNHSDIIVVALNLYINPKDIEAPTTLEESDKWRLFVMEPKHSHISFCRAR